MILFLLSPDAAGVMEVSFNGPPPTRFRMPSQRTQVKATAVSIAQLVARTPKTQTREYKLLYQDSVCATYEEVRA